MRSSSTRIFPPLDKRPAMRTTRDGPGERRCGLVVTCEAILTRRAMIALSSRTTSETARAGGACRRRCGSAAPASCCAAARGRGTAVRRARAAARPPRTRARKEKTPPWRHHHGARRRVRQTATLSGDAASDPYAPRRATASAARGASFDSGAEWGARTTSRFVRRGRWATDLYLEMGHAISIVT